jgi:cytochrome c oxidase subunit 1
VFDRIPAPADPWGSKSIEWTLPSPVPVQNFDRIPVFSGDPYGYGETGPAAFPAGAPAGMN